MFTILKSVENFPFFYRFNFPPMKRLSLSEYYVRIKRFYRESGRMPTFSEMLPLFCFKSKNAVSQVVDRLVVQKLVKKDHTGRLIATSAYTGIKVLGFVEAGFPTAAEEEVLETLALDEYLIKNHEATFMLKVSGESMKDAGICPGDLVVLERGKLPHNGDIVVAEVDHQWTMKYYEHAQGRVRLLPANSQFSPIVPKEQLFIAGVVVGVVRKYA